MVFGEPGAGRDSLRLEPDDGLHAFGVRVIADLAQALGKSPRIDFPRARLRPTDRIAGIPAGVHPPVIELQAFFEVAIDEEDLVFRSLVLYISSN